MYIPDIPASARRQGSARDEFAPSGSISPFPTGIFYPGPLPATWRCRRVLTASSKKDMILAPDNLDRTAALDG